jgi:hypothetical protein
MRAMTLDTVSLLDAIDAGPASPRDEQRADHVRDVDHAEEEALALERFRDLSGELPGDVARGADPPDFVVTHGGRRTAVEMTRYHQDAGPRGSAGAKHESLERRVMALAETLFETANPGVHVRLSLYFRRGALRRSDVRRVAERLSALVPHTMPPEPSDSEGPTPRRVSWSELNRAGLDEALVELTVYRWRRMRRGEWYAPVGGGVSADVSSIEARIRDKELDLASYRATVDECWLIVYAPWHHASSFFDAEVLSPGMLESSFDKVVFVDVSLGRFVPVA